MSFTRFGYLISRICKDCARLTWQRSRINHFERSNRRFARDKEKRHKKIRLRIWNFLNRRSVVSPSPNSPDSFLSFSFISICFHFSATQSSRGRGNTEVRLIEADSVIFISFSFFIVTSRFSHAQLEPLICTRAGKSSRSYLKARREMAVAGPRVIAEVQAGRVAVVQNVFQSVSGQLQDAESKES